MTEHILSILDDAIEAVSGKRRGRGAPPGAGHWCARLTWEQVEEIRATGEERTIYETARIYGVNYLTIWKVLRYRSYVLR